MQKFFRIVIGTNNIDGCARVCHAPTAMGMQWAYGTGAATNSVDEIYKTGCILIIGANPSSAHPVTGARIRSVVESGTPLIVIDPLKLEIARLAEHHLQIIPNKCGCSEPLCPIPADRGLIDEEFISGRTEGWRASKIILNILMFDDLERICGVEREK
jgi:formate dehydrogenase major subunit